jgi:toxin ParE1/3/4
MSRILRTTPSRDDLQEIWLFIARDNPSAADALIHSIEQKLRTLASSPLMSRSAASLGRDLRVAPVGDYLIFYKAIDDGVVLIRVLHGARNLMPEYFE